MLSFEELRAPVESGEVDTVVVAFTDMQGRLTGKRLHAEFFVEEVGAGHPVEGCNYLLALEMEMDPVPGYEIAKFWKPPMPRKSSCAYPSLCRVCSSLSYWRGPGGGAVSIRPPRTSVS
jgi:hypothetical protein